MVSSTVRSKKVRLPSLASRNGTMERVLIITEDEKATGSLCQEIKRGGYECTTVSYDGVQEVVGEKPPHLIVVDNSRRFDTAGWELVIGITKKKKLPLIALVAAENLDRLNNRNGIDDFIIYPGNNTELLLRIKRLLLKISEADKGEKIRCDGLTIDLVTCEVTVDGVKTELTYKEFELLKLMAGDRGRVFTREDLLNKIWGYDYYGGDRTVDVHMRRLRSKIEDASHTYIETVRNIGYRFIKDSES